MQPRMETRLAYRFSLHSTLANVPDSQANPKNRYLINDGHVRMVVTRSPQAMLRISRYVVDFKSSFLLITWITSELPTQDTMKVQLVRRVNDTLDVRDKSSITVDKKNKQGYFLALNQVYKFICRK